MKIELNGSYNQIRKILKDFNNKNDPMVIYNDQKHGSLLEKDCTYYKRIAQRLYKALYCLDDKFTMATGVGDENSDHAEKLLSKYKYPLKIKN